MLCFIKQQYNGAGESTTVAQPRCFPEESPPCDRPSIKGSLLGEGKGTGKWEEAEKGGGTEQDRKRTERREEEAGQVSAVHGTYYNINYILGHKVTLARQKNIEITPCIPFNHHRLKLYIINIRTYTCSCYLNQNKQKIRDQYSL